MSILILDLCNQKNSLHKEEFVRPVEDIVQENFETKHFLDEYNPGNYEKVILCGVSLKDFEYLNHLESFNWVKTFEKPLLGICAGAQIIAKQFEAELKEFQEIGLQQIEKVEEDIILEGVSLKEIYSLHNSSFEVPKEFTILLKNSIPQLIKNKQTYACLFHPEVRNKKIIENFLKENSYLRGNCNKWENFN